MPIDPYSLKVKYDLSEASRNLLERVIGNEGIRLNVGNFFQQAIQSTGFNPNAYSGGEAEHVANLVRDKAKELFFISLLRSGKVPSNVQQPQIWEEQRDKLIQGLPIEILEDKSIKDVILLRAKNPPEMPTSRATAQTQAPEEGSLIDKFLAEKTAGLDFRSFSAILSNAKIPPTDVVLRNLASGYLDEAKEDFIKTVGREPEKAELVAIFNRANFAGIPGSKLSFDFPEQALFNSKDIYDSIRKTGQVGSASVINELLPKFQIITETNERLKGAGTKLSDSQVLQVANHLISNEEAQKLASTFSTSVQEARIQEEFPKIAAQEQAAVTGLETSLGESAKKLFEEQRPFTERLLAARGLLRSGSLQEAFGRQLGELATRREEQIAPLRAQTSLGAIQRSFTETLRKALESGQSLREATAFAQSALESERSRTFTAAQAALARQFESEMFRQQQALQLALAGQRGGGGALQDFFRFGLPVLGQLGGGALGGFLASRGGEG